MADTNDTWQTSLRNRLQAINQIGEEQTTWSQFQAQKQRALAAQQQRMQELDAQYAGLQAAAQQSAGTNSITNTGQPVGTGNSDFDRFKNAIAGVESGGNYGARNPSGAMGKYQIMPANLGGSKSGWDYQALGYDVSPAQFMGSPEIQEKIATYFLGKYYQQYGPAGAAVAWYAGPGRVNNPNADMQRYRQAVLDRMR